MITFKVSNITRTVSNNFRFYKNWKIFSLYENFIDKINLVMYAILLVCLEIILNQNFLKINQGSSHYFHKL